MKTKEKLENTDKKKRTSGKLFLLLALAVMLTGSAYSIWKHFEDKKESDSTYEPEIVVEENQELVCGQITKLNGNEISFDIVEEVSLESDSSDSDTSEEQVSGNRTGRSGTRPDQVSGDQSVSGNESGQKANAGVSENASGEMPSGEMPSGEMPSGEMPSGEMPSGEIPSGEMPSGNAPGGEVASTDGTDKSTTEDSVIYQSTGESKDLQIPVGTKIITELGNEITFSRLAVGDVVKLLMEKDSNGEEEVVKLWIVG